MLQVDDKFGLKRYDLLAIRIMPFKSLNTAFT